MAETISDDDDVRRGVTDSGLTHWELWLRYVGLGGTSSLDHFSELLENANLEPSRQERNLIALALNEFWLDDGSDRRITYVEATDAGAHPDSQ